CADPVPMVEFVRDHPRASPRVWRMFLAAFWGWQSHRLPDPKDGEELRRRAERTEAWGETDKLRGVRASVSTNVIFFNRNAAEAAPTARARLSGEGGCAAARPPPLSLRPSCAPPRSARGAPARAWFPPPAVALAQGIYEERAFDRLPILADALQDAGCIDER